MDTSVFDSHESPRSGVLKSLGVATLIGALAGATVGPAFAQTAAIRPVIRVQHIQSLDGTNPFSSWRGYSYVPLHTNAERSAIARAAATSSVPYWTASVTSPLDGITYTTSMVGSSPYATTPSNTNVSYVPIILKITVKTRRSSVTFDPTKPACNDSVAVSSRFFNSPLFQPVAVTSNGVNVGSGQLISEYQRANFWSNVGGTGYGVTLTPTTTTPIVYSASMSGTIYSITCANGTSARLGAVSINTFDSTIQSIAKAYPPSQLPVILTYNVVQTQNGCCILGYHNAVAVTGGALTYAVGSYIDSGVFSGVDDVVVWSHEMGEWMDDPFVQAPVSGGGNDDLTPAWGNVGQVSGCQNNLENGDPLSGTEFAIAGAGGFTYHYQDLAFHDWFYRTPSTGTGGKYSFVGTFASFQPTVC